jgi:adenylate cyclase
MRDDGGFFVQGLQELIDWIIGEGLSSRSVEQIMEGLGP